MSLVGGVDAGVPASSRGCKRVYEERAEGCVGSSTVWGRLGNGLTEGSLWVPGDLEFIR